MTFQELFQGKKAVIAMLHLKGSTPQKIMELAKQEIDIYYRNGVDAVLVENYFSGSSNCVRALRYLQENYPDKIYGVNILGSEEKAFNMADRYGAKFIQIDSVCGHLAPKWDAQYEKELAARRAGSGALVFGGVRFKYQPVASGRTVEEDLAIGMNRCDAIVVTGEGTGIRTPEEKMAQFRSAMGDFPLIAGAGVTMESVAQTLTICDAVIVGSWMKYDHDAYGDVCEEYVQQFMAAARGEV